MQVEKTLLNPEEIQSFTGIKGDIGEVLSKVLMKIFKIDKINSLYSNSYDADPISFIDRALNELDFHYELDEKDLERIPKEGPFIVVANHPIGGLEGIALIKLIHQIRPDFKLIGNFMLKRVEPISDLIFPVNPFENKSHQSNTSGIKSALQHIKSGGCMGIFPAGEVSSFHFNSKKVADKPWQKGAIKLIQKANAPVVPVWFEGNNSGMFHLLGMLHPAMRTAKLPSELFNKRRQKLSVRIGKPISLKEQA